MFFKKFKDDLLLTVIFSENKTNSSELKTSNHVYALGGSHFRRKIILIIVNTSFLSKPYLAIFIYVCHTIKRVKFVTF